MAEPDAMQIDVRVVVAPYPGPVGASGTRYGTVEIPVPALVNVLATPEELQRVASDLARALQPHAEEWVNEQGKKLGQ